jgi:hypothetical protein
LEVTGVEIKVAVRWERIGNNVVRDGRFKHWFAVGLEPGVTDYFTVGIISDTKENVRGDSILQKVAVQYGCALPADWFEKQDIS